MENHILLILSMAFVYGICTGSFVTMASYRIPLGREIVFKPSYCPHCNAKLKIPDLIPLFSWILQKGQCRYCHARIGIRYPLIELCMGLCFAVVVWRYGVNVDSVLLLLLATALGIMIVVDLEHYIIPDSVQVAVLAMGIAFRFYNGSGFEDILLSMGTGLAIGLSLHYGALLLLKKDALGFGDVKFFCVSGSWLPIADFVPYLFFSGLIGTITGLLWRAAGRGKVFPFGPGLACSLFLNLLMPHMLQRIIVIPPPPVLY